MKRVATFQIEDGWKTTFINIYGEKKYLTFGKLFKKTEIPFSEIKKIEYSITDGKNGVGRGIIGGVLAGTTGAVIAAGSRKVFAYVRIETNDEVYEANGELKSGKNILQNTLIELQHHIGKTTTE